MYIGKFRDIDNTLYTVKLKHRDEVEVDKPTITLDIAEYINLNHGYVSYGVHAVYENRDASFTYQGKTYTARIFRVTGATNDGAPLTQLFVYTTADWHKHKYIYDDELVVRDIWSADEFFNNAHNYQLDSPHMERSGLFELTLGETPITISQNSDNLFSEIKSCNCTIQILTDDLISDFYAYNYTDVEVYIYRQDSVTATDKCIFEGYLTPYIYNQPYAEYLDTLELEVVSKLATLKEIDYYQIGEKLEIVNFYELLNHILIEGAGYNVDNLCIKTRFGNNHAITSFKISESNFFDNDTEAKPWKMHDVLTEMFKFLGVSCFEWENVIYIVDYQYLSATNNDFTFSVYKNGKIGGTFEQQTPKFKRITQDDYTSNDTNISYEEVYNKVTINANAYNIDELCPDLEDLKYSSNLSTYPESLTWWHKTYKRNGSVKSTEYTYNTYNTFRMLDASSNWKHRYWRIKPNTTNYEDGMYAVEINTDPSQTQDRWWDPDSFSTYNSTRYDNINTRCAFIGRYASYPLKDGIVPSSLDWDTYIGFNCLDDSINYIQMENPGGLYPNWLMTVSKYLDVLECPVLEYEMPDPIRFSPNTGKSWITIKGEILYQHNNIQGSTRNHVTNTSEKYIHTIPLDNILDVEEGRFAVYKNDCYDSDGIVEKSKVKDKNKLATFPIRKKDNSQYGKGFPLVKCKLQIGDKYWDGYNWTTDESTFYLSFNNSPSGGEDETFNVWGWQKIVSNTTFTSKVNEDNCYSIPITKNDNIAGRLKFTLYTPSQLRPIFEGTNYKLRWNSLFPLVYMKGLELDYVYTDNGRWFLSDDEKEEEDIVYTNTVDTAFSHEYEELEYKINTYTDNVPISRSFIMTGVNKEYTTDFTNITTKRTDRMEHHNIEKILQHYIDKKLVVETTIKCYKDGMESTIVPYLPTFIRASSVNTFANKVFLLDKYEFDVKHNNIKTTLIEW